MIIRKAILEARNLENMQRFYQTIPGLEAARIQNEMLIIPAGKSTLIFEASDAQELAPVHFAFNIPFSVNRFPKCVYYSSYYFLSNINGSNSLGSFYSVSFFYFS